VMGSPNFVEGWAIPNEAAVALKNEGVKNAKHLSKLRRDGAFSESAEEIRNVSKGEDRPTWEYHIPSCRKALKRHFSKRRWQNPSQGESAG
jgi:hypothetical protein